MFIFYFLLIFLAFLLVLTILSSVIKFSLLLTTRHKYETSLLIVPSILNLISWSIILYLWSITINHVIGKDIFTIIFDKILNLLSLREIIVSLLPTTIIYLLIGLILQALSFFSVNIPYRKIKNKIKLFINKIFKIELKINEDVKAIVISDDEEKLNLLNSFIASIFTFSLVFFIITMCFSVGHIISDKVMTLLKT